MPSQTHNQIFDDIRKKMQGLRVDSKGSEQSVRYLEWRREQDGSYSAVLVRLYPWYTPAKNAEELVMKTVSAEDYFLIALANRENEELDKTFKDYNNSNH